MKFNKVALTVFILVCLLAISHASANDLGVNETVELAGGVPISVDADSIYVDDIEGNDLNDGLSQDTSVKSLVRAISLAKENATIHIASGNYRSEGNTKLVIDKSVNFIGSENTTFDGQNMNHFFTINDNVCVTFKNINFINAYKIPNGDESVSGSVLDIKNAKVTVDSCSFENNLVNHNTKSAVYGGAISNMGDLIILNSYFNKNSLAIAQSAQGLFSQGGTIYNQGNLTIRNSSFFKSRSGVYSSGAAIANNRGNLIIDASTIADSHISSQSKGSAIYNSGNLILTNSIIKNNVIEKTGLNQIFGAIFNEGNFTAVGNIFQNNSAVFDSSSIAFKGSANIYNNGNLNLTYNAFIGNAYATDISKDVFDNGGKILSLENNWWDTNGNPTKESHVNTDEVYSWLTFTVTPEYSALNISDSVVITAAWKSTAGTAQISLFPIFNVTFKTSGIVKTEELKNGKSEFLFNYTQNKGLYEVTGDVCGFKRTVEVDVGKLISDLSFNVTDNIEYLDTLKINISVEGNGVIALAGKVSIKLNDKEYIVELKDGKAHLEIPDLTPSRYNLTFTYLGSEEYFKAFGNTTVTVKKQPVNLTLTIPSIRIDEKQTKATVTLNTKGAQGQAALYLNGAKKQNVYLYNGDTTLTLKNLAEGEYNATLVFLGNEKYESANVSTTFKVSKYSTVLNIYAHDIDAGENISILIEALPEELRGEAVLSINGVNQSIWIGSANTTVNISNLSPGLYEVSVTYKGDSKYYGANDTTSFRVIRPQSSLDADIVKDDLALNGTITVRTNPLNCTGLIGVYVNYKFYSMNLTDGEARFNVEFDEGSNYIFIYYEGDDTHEGSTWNTTLGVADKFIFIGENSTSFEHNDFNYSVRLVEVTGIAMPNRNVVVKFLNETHYILTDEDGFAYLPLNLEKGVYEISASYENQTILNTITVNEISFEVSANDTAYGEDAVIEISANENLTGRFNIIIPEILDITVDIIKGCAVYSVSGLNASDYTVNVKYVNDHFNSTPVVKEFTVKKADLNASVDFNQRQFIITVANLGNATGNLTLIIDGEEHCIAINNSQVILNRNLTNGNHTLHVRYAGDDNYNSYDLSTFIYVKEFSTDIILSIDDGVYGEELTAVAKLEKDATGYIRFEVNNITEDVKIENGVAAWTFGNINAGNYTLKAIYGGDDLYLESDNSTSFEVSKADSNIRVFVKEAVLDENIRIYANLTDGATGSVLFSMEGYYSPRYKNVRNSQSQWYISPLNTGSYKVFASYIGDNNFKASNTTYILNIYQKRVILEVNIDDVRVIDRVTVNVKLTNASGNPLNGVVNLELNSNSYEINVENGEASMVIGRLPAGNYSYSAAFAGNDEYAKRSVGGSFEVRDSLLNVTIAANNLTKYYKGSQKLTFTVKASNGKAVSNAVVYVKINGKEYSVKTDSNGKASMDINLNPGNYTAKIILKEDDFYHESSAEASLTILSTVEGIDLVKLYGSSNQYFAIFCDSEGKVLSNTKVKFTIGSNSYTATTLPNGIVRLNINLNVGKYSITAINPKTKQKAVNSIFIFNYLMENKDLTQLYGAKKTYSVRAYGDNGKPVGKGVVVKMKVNGVTYKVKTDKNGYAKLTINLKPKKYTITAEYKGYKVSNKITVKPLLSAKNISKKKSKTTKFSAKLVNSKGKIQKGKKVTFKIHGKKYTAKTNKKGIATVTIKTTLKVGKHKIYSSYGKSKITNTITIKR
ncbi:MAG: hypothetical protein Q4Q14_03560 [Methanobrevibacter sp.]|nr:hypothetical protein [Methanobrevibacter sp.]